MRKLLTIFRPIVLRTLPRTEEPVSRFQGLKNSGAGWLIATVIILFLGTVPTGIISPLGKLQPLKNPKPAQTEVFGFAPYWTLNNLDNVDFSTLTTLAYFGIPVRPNGELDKNGVGYTTFRSEKATDLFKKAHAHSTKVVLTITLMDNSGIESVLRSEEAQEKAIAQTIGEVENRGIDGVNIDFEYIGNPGDEYKNRFTRFVARMNEELTKHNPNSYLTVSVYAGSLLEPKLYDIEKVANNSDGIFMMAYDYAAWKATNVIPTAPLYGYKEGKYWYDVSSAVEDFLKVMDPGKLILGMPWYGYDYPVYQPGVKTETHKGYTTYTRQTYKVKGRTYSRLKKNFVKPAVTVKTYKNAQSQIAASGDNIVDYQEGWDDVGKVAWRAYKTAGSATWRMVFVEDAQSLGHKYNFAKEKNLGGVGIWALGFDAGTTELWDQLAVEFGDKTENHALVRRVIANQYD